MNATAALLLIALISPLQPTDVIVSPGVPPSEGPDAFVEIQHVDLGTLREGSVGEAVFKLQNRGKAELVISSISASCGCTTVRLSDDDKKVPPGQTRDIVARFDTRGRLGKQRKVVTLRTNDPTEPVLRLTLSANVETLFRVLPRTLINMRSVHRGDQLEPLELYPTDADATLGEVDISVRGAALNHALEPIRSDEGVRGYKVKLSIPERAELGAVSGMMTITATVGGEKATVPVRLAGSVVGNIVARPVALQSLGLTPRGRQFAPVTIASTTLSTFRIVSTDAGPHIKVQVKPIKPGKEYQIRTSLADTAPDGPLATTLVIRTDDATMPLVRVPMFVNVRPRFMVEPPMVLLSQSDNTRRVRIAGGTGSWAVKGVSCDDPRVRVAVESGPPNDPDGRYLRVTLSSSDVASDARTEVVVSTDDAVAPQIHIPVVLAGPSS